MTLSELHKMRSLRARPATPIVMTENDDVHLFCAANDLPVIWVPGLQENADLRPLHGLDVWLIDCANELIEKVREIKPGPMWITGRFGFAYKINTIVGRQVLWN